MMPDAIALPHGPPIRMIDSVESISDAKGRCTSMVAEDNPFLSEDGTLEPAAFVEMIAQAFAAWGASRDDAPTENKGGMLVAVTDFQVLGRASVGDRLSINVEQTAMVHPFFMVEGSVTKDDAVVARAALRVVTQ